MLILTYIIHSGFISGLPWQMGILAKIMRLLPDWLFDKIVSNRKQKPRKKDL